MEWVLSVGSAGKLSRQSDSLEQLCLPLLHTYIHTLLQHCMYTVATTYRVCMLHVLLLYSANSCQGHGRKSTLCSLHYSVHI